MNWFSNKTLGLAASGWLVVSTVGQIPLAAAPATSSPPPEIKLNGLTTILGDKRALFKVRPDSSPVESYCLAEGQSAGGIKLLSVDVQAGRIKVNNHGVIQTASLCDAPDLSILTATEAGGGENGNNFSPRKNAANSFGKSSGGVATAASQTTGVATAGQNSAAAVPAGKSTAGAANGSPGTAASNNSGNSGNSSNPGSPDASSQNSGNASTSNNSQLPEPFSLRSAREFERIRIETANDVYNGTDEPLPLTPLTPPGTPKALIGTDRAWFPPDSTFDP